MKNLLMKKHALQAAGLGLLLVGGLCGCTESRTGTISDTRPMWATTIKDELDSEQQAEQRARFRALWGDHLSTDYPALKND